MPRAANVLQRRSSNPYLLLRKLTSLVLLSALLAGCLTSLARAQTWPAHSLRIVVSLSPGSSSDITARLVADGLSRLLGQTVVVENRPGAGGRVAGEYVSRAAPDGYTMLLASIATHGINPAITKNLGYDPIRDFTPIIALASSPNALVITPSIPANNLSEFIAWLRAQPAGSVNYSSGGEGTSMHLAAEMFNTMIGVKTEHVPFKGTPEGLTAVMTGQTAFMFPNSPNAVPLAKGGKVRLIAATSLKRASWMPDVPTMAESGLPGYEMVAWFGLVAPAGVPTPIVDRLSVELRKVLTLPSVKEGLTSQGLDVMGGTPQALGALIASEIDNWPKVARAAGMQIQ